MLGGAYVWLECSGCGGTCHGDAFQVFEMLWHLANQALPRCARGQVDRPGLVTLLHRLHCRIECTISGIRILSRPNGRRGAPKTRRPNTTSPWERGIAVISCQFSESRNRCESFRTSVGKPPIITGNRPCCTNPSRFAPKGSEAVLDRGPLPT